jgi:serine/threonine protein kinase
MAKKNHRDEGEQSETPDLDAARENDRFPDKALVKAFAEDLLRKKGQQGSYQPVESQRRAAGGTLQRPSPREPEAPSPPAPRPRVSGGTGATLPANTHRPRLDSADDVIEGCADCLSEDSILAFVQGTLTGAELVRTHRHLDICPECQRLIVEAVHAISAGRREAATSDPQGSALRAGVVLANRYRIQRFVARGGMGEVYEAYDRTLRERVALKTVMPTVSDSPRAVRRLMAEVQLARRVSHTNVCRIYDLGAEQVADGESTLHFLTMEFVEGLSLAQELERGGPMKVDAAVDIARQLLSGLDAAHQAGILHRDFKPDNIMLRPTNGTRQRAVIMDFGLARAMDVDPARLTTGANQPLIGTLTYMAPEQVEGGDLTAGTDIFAFGIVFFEMLTGCVPFIGGSPAATALKRLKEAPPGPIEYAPHVPKHINRIVLKCLARHPSKRYASAAEVLLALEDEPNALTAAVEPPSRWRYTVGGVGAAAVLLALLWVIVPGSAEPPGPNPGSERNAGAGRTARPGPNPGSGSNANAERKSDTPRGSDGVVVRAATTAEDAKSALPEAAAPAAAADARTRVPGHVATKSKDLPRPGAVKPQRPMPPVASAPSLEPPTAESSRPSMAELMVPSIFGQPPPVAESSANSKSMVAPQETGARIGER